MFPKKSWSTWLRQAGAMSSCGPVDLGRRVLAVDPAALGSGRLFSGVATSGGIAPSVAEDECQLCSNRAALILRYKQPRGRSPKTLKEWCSFECHSVVLDLGESFLEDDDL